MHRNSRVSVCAFMILNTVTNTRNAAPQVLWLCLAAIFLVPQCTISAPISAACLIALHLIVMFPLCGAGLYQRPKYAFMGNNLCPCPNFILLACCTTNQGLESIYELHWRTLQILRIRNQRPFICLGLNSRIKFFQRI